MNPEIDKGRRSSWARKIAIAAVITGSVYAGSCFKRPGVPDNNKILPGYDPVDCKTILDKSASFELDQGTRFLVAGVPLSIVDTRLVNPDGEQVVSITVSKPRRKYTVGIIGQTTTQPETPQEHTTYTVRIDGECLE